VILLGCAYLILENGAVFKGRSFGYDGEATGELVFSTSMAGYLETLSDPAHFGQIVVQTFPLVGNYGVIPHDLGAGPVHLKAYIVRQWCQEPSNFRSEGDLDSFLRMHKVPGLCDIDTRALARAIRENGSMNAKLSKAPEPGDDCLTELRGDSIADAVSAVSMQCKNHRLQATKSGVGEPGCQEQGGGSGGEVVIWDFGCAERLARVMTGLKCPAVIVGHGATACEIAALAPAGVVLSGGPGDPAENLRIIEEIGKLCGCGVPILGVGLDHQMLALARGAKTQKLHFGHRGLNQPVRECKTGRCFVTTQNHGYAVAGALPGSAAISYENINDGTCEGIDYADIPAFSTQFDPPGDIIARFLSMTKGGA